MTPAAGEKPTVTTLRPQLIQAWAGRRSAGQRRGAAPIRRAAEQSQCIPGGLSRRGSEYCRERNATLGSSSMRWRATRPAQRAAEPLFAARRAKDEALAKRALDLAITDEPGKTVSAGMIGAVAGRASGPGARFRPHPLVGSSEVRRLYRRSRGSSGGLRPEATMKRRSPSSRPMRTRTSPRPIANRSTKRSTSFACGSRPSRG